MKTQRIKLFIVVSLLILRGFIADGDAAEKKVPSATAPRGITVQFEFIETDHADLIDLLFDKGIQTDASDMRKQIQEKVKSGKAGIVDTVLFQTRDGMRANIMSADEIKYPQSYDEAGKFEIQPAGITVKADPSVSDSGSSILMNIQVEVCEKVADTDFGNNPKGVRVIQPQFHKARLETAVTVADGAYAFIGTVRLYKKYDPNRKDPVVMVFVRALLHQQGQE
jgi:hypothetical protein